MSYCINPACSHPENPEDASQCQTCRSKLVLRNRYRVIKPLGKGGFGATFLSEDLSLPGSPKCVVKQLRPVAKSARVLEMARQLFQREATTLGKIGDHPQIPRLLDYFSGKQQFYLVQEYVDGRNLKEEVQQSGVYTEDDIKAFLREILPILSYIHSHEVIHRDIKPANILRRAQDQRLVLIDFGAVKDEVKQVTEFGTGQTAFTNFAIGTSGFAPPEQMALRPVYASDIYAVGMTCVYLMTGKSPSSLDHNPITAEVLWRALVSVSDSFAAILQKMLEMSVYQRYQSAEEVLGALDHETEFYTDFSDGLSVQPEPRVSEAPTQVETHQQDNQTTIYCDDESTALRPFASQAKQIRERNARRQKKEYTQLGENFASVDGGISATQGAPTATMFTSANTPARNKLHRWDESSLHDAYIRGDRYFTDCDLQGLNLRSEKFSGAYFTKSRLEQTNFQNADLSKVDFARASLSDTIFKDANLTHARLSYANLENADLRGANLTYANLSYANLRGTNLCGANLTHALVSEQQLALAKTNWRTILPNRKRKFGL
ncbi:serine/threonine-protein kinase [Lyngbya sp. PCC 8106]|uniref:serine/threonine-protein kinase n=1 Tax=Lyngbya sp. (strain PCC 8106) TaxID=313612 RepID=UPI0000EA9BE3|nr:serine/threonine-protein kinase [Lyngbya sp. PCC 8106]EAW37332.1 Serine/Threonine protein kinase [Lyngbya sp. PCC 8106]